MKYWLAFLILVTAPAQADEQKSAFQYCANRAETTFYIAQEKIYNHGDTQKLMQFMRKGMDRELFLLTKDVFSQAGEWVDKHEYETAKDYAATAMYECLTASYHEMKIELDERTALYMRKFQDILDQTEERLYPFELNTGADI